MKSSFIQLIAALLICATWIYSSGQLVGATKMEIASLKQEQGTLCQTISDMRAQLVMLSDGQAETLRLIQVIQAEQRILHGRSR